MLTHRRRDMLILFRVNSCYPNCLSIGCPRHFLQS